MEQETKDRKVLWIDVETTGTDPEKHGIVQIAGLVEINGEVVEEFDIHTKPLPEDLIEFSVIDAVGLDLLAIREYPGPDKALKNLLTILDKYIVKFDKTDKFHPAGYNVKFDLDFLWQFCRKMEFRYFHSYVDHFAIDVYAVTRYLAGFGMVEAESLKMAHVYEVMIGKPLENAHDALADIKATRELAYELNRRFMSTTLAGWEDE